MTTESAARRFYNREYQGTRYANWSGGEGHPCGAQVRKFVETYGLHGKKCLEVGAGRGVFQGLSVDYVGVDLSESVATGFSRPFVVASATKLPFRDEVFAGCFTVHALEHVPDPESAVHEMRRVLKPGGVLFLAPAWHCRPWAATGIATRPYGESGWADRLRKASLGVRERLWWRAGITLPVRLFRYLLWRCSPRPVPLRYRELQPNLDEFIVADSDAAAAMDPFDAWLWFVSRGDQCLSHPGFREAFLARHEPLILRKSAGV